MPSEVRTEYVEETKAAGGEVTTSGLLRRRAEREAARREDSATGLIYQTLDAAPGLYSGL